MTQRTDKLASQMLREIQSLITRGLNDPRVRGLVSVTNVRVMPDLTEAVVSVSVLPQAAESLTLQGLQSAAAHMRSQLARVLDIRRTPRLVFKLDHALKKQAAIDMAINADALNAERRGEHAHPDSEEMAK